nr:uncharacterized protein LOC110383324 [Helicoverpa armigera]
MDNWASVVSSYPEVPEPKHYAKAIHSAEIIISQDLAPFEIEWLAQTLLFKPINLFETISTKRTNAEWQKTVADSFKLLAKLVDKYWDVVETYYNDIIALCTLSLDAATRKEALCCLVGIVKRPAVDVTDELVARHVNALEEATSCKAPLAQLVGTICRYHPEKVQEHHTRIWRIYLKMLQPNNKTDSIVNAVLQGINGLFEHFGDDIEVSQLNSFYDTMTRECIKISKCFEVLLSIFKHHARLFREKLSKDAALRMYMWQFDNKSSLEALCSVYKVVLEASENPEAILRSEVVPHTASRSVVIKLAALNIVILSGTRLTSEVTQCTVELELLLKNKKLSYEEANTISWSINSNASNSETMLLTAIMYSDNLPSSMRDDIIVNGILKASEDVRKAAVIAVVVLSLRAGSDQHLCTWRALLHNTSAVQLCAQAVQHVLEVAVNVAGNPETTYEDIKPCLHLLSMLLNLQNIEPYLEDWCIAFRPTVVHLSKLYNVPTLEMLTETDDNQIMYVEKFEDDTVLNHLLSTLSTKTEHRQNHTLTALYTMISKQDIDYKVLSKVLSKIEASIENNAENIDKRQLSMIINQLKMLKSKAVTDTKDARIFQKDVTMFLGKYGRLTGEENFSEDIYALNLKNKLTLNIPNIVEGTTFKIDLQRIFQLSLLRGDTEALYCLLVILTASLCETKHASTQAACIRVVRVMRHTHIDVCVALAMCHTAASVQDIMKAITEELSPKVRSKLADCLQFLLTHDPGSETTSELLKLVGEQAVFMISRDESPTFIPGLDITRAFLSALTDNNNLTTEHLPTILKYTSNAPQNYSEIFNTSSDIFIEKIDLFNETQIMDTIVQILEHFSTNIFTVDAVGRTSGCITYDAYESEVMNIESNLNTILSFIKRVIEKKNLKPTILIEIVLKMCKKLTIISPQFLNLVTLLASINLNFEFENDDRKKVVDFQNGFLIHELMKIKLDEMDDIKVNSALLFLKEYAVELKENCIEKTLNCLARIIEHIPPTTVLLVKKNLSSCLATYKNDSTHSPTIIESYEKWCKKLDLQNITECIENKTFISEFQEKYSEIVHALKVFSEIFKTPILEMSNWTLVLVKKLSQEGLKWGKLFLLDVFSVSEICLSESDFEVILEENIDFVKSYISVYFQRLIKKPFVVKREKCELLLEVIEYFSKNYKEDNLQDVLDFADHLWPHFVQTRPFDDKISALLNILRLPKSVGLHNAVVTWGIDVLSSDASMDEKIKVFACLPAGEEYGPFYRSFVSYLPVRLSELQGRYIPPFRALLDALANNMDMTLFDIVITLAGGDDTTGWWDQAIEACITSLASKEDIRIYDKAYAKAKSSNSLGVCNRIFLPLLRHSSRKFCEKYISTIITDLFNTLRVGFREPANNEAYRKRLVSYAIAFNILQVAFEKISTEALENGPINECAGSQKPWYCLEQASKYCVTVSSKAVCPTDASHEMKTTCLWLQCSSYNCLTTAICRRKLSKNLCARIFNVQVWAKIVDVDAVYEFELKDHARYKGHLPAKRPVDAVATSSSFTGTVRSRLFLTTLSENPLQFDMIPLDEEEEEEEEELPSKYEDSVLNKHGCLSTVTAALEHAATVQHTEWRDAVVSAVSSHVELNVKWIIAQAICNAEEALKPHAGVLTPALFQLIADTCTINNGKHVLNNLHVEILTTITKWSTTDLQPSTYLDTTIEYLINTCLSFKHRYKLHRRLLNVLDGLLKIFGKIANVKWSIFQDNFKDNQKDYLPILERLLKNHIYLPELLPSIFFYTDSNHWLGNVKLAEVSGLSLSMSDPETRKEFLTKFWTILNGARSSNAYSSYVKILFYAQKYCKECCDFNQLKIITDLAPKLEKSKCLTIISNYLEHFPNSDDFFTEMLETINLKELLDSDLRLEAMKIARNSLKFMEMVDREDILKMVGVNSKSSSVHVRKEAFGVFLAAFKDLVKRESQNPFKRKATDTSPILDLIDTQTTYEKIVLENIFRGLFDNDDDISKMMTDGVEECVSKDINMRFAELFFIIVYQCSVSYNNVLDLSKCGAKLLEMLFSDLRSQEAFKVIALRDQGLPQSLLKSFESTTRRTRTNVRTVVRSGVTYRQRTVKAPPSREINVQMTITEILGVFLQFSKTNTEACQELCSQIMKCLQGTGRRFNLDSVMAKQLSHIMREPPNCLTSIVLDACRIFVKDICYIQGFKQSVQSLKLAVKNSEGYLYTNILLEDILLRSGDKNLFIFSMMKEDSDTTMRDQEFSLQGLIDIFGTLSNWDDLRIQDKRQIEESLPPLWTTNEDFTVSLRNYFDADNKKLDYNLWFNKMVASHYPEEVTVNRINWLKQTDRWPTRHFVISAIIEALQWNQNESKIFAEIAPNDCLAEWAARLMIRSSYYNQLSDSDSSDRVSLSSDELFYCREANRRQIPSVALQCVERNKHRLLDTEILPWIQEKVKAYRCVGLRESNTNLLQKALDAAEKQTVRFASQSTFETNVSMQTLILKLHHDLQSLSINKLNDVLQTVTNYIIREKSKVLSSNDLKTMKSVYETSMVYYDEMWNDNDESIQNDIIQRIVEIIGKMLDYNLAEDYNLLISVLLNRLAYHETTISDVTAKSFIEKIHRIFHRLDFFSVAILKKVLAVLPTHVLTENYLNKLQDTELDVCKEYFKLICDVNYSLLQYCSEMRRNILDEEEFNSIFKRMKSRLFETKYGGTDYQSLNTLKTKLYALENITDIDTKAKELKLIIDELHLKTQRSVLRLSQICPELCAPAILERKRLHLQRLLRLPENVYVVKFFEQMSVFTDAICRPCVVKALLTNGQTRRFICKSGEPLYRDASVQRAADILSVMHPELCVRSYNVTPLSEDSAIIEFLEDHVRLRELIEEKHDINSIAPNKPWNEKVILAPSLAMEQYNDMCAKVTPYMLRSSIENNCSCVKEFIQKKKMFEDTLSSMTILCWLFGVGDRHLQNIMFSMRDGGLCAVDWTSACQYATRELTPARLTTNIVAVTDVTVLESRLQTIMLCLRENVKLYEAFIRTSFYWCGPEFKELKHVINILQGKAVSYGITRECIEESNKKYKAEYIKLLDQVFENFVPKETYSVEEQVSCLLQHCTDPRILSITPSNWEPWL